MRLFTSVTLVTAAFLLSACVGFLATPRGLKCGAGDVNTGGNNEAGGMSDAMRKACLGDIHSEPVDQCCYKVLFVITQSCELRWSVPAGRPCMCFYENGMPMAQGLACAAGTE